MHVILFTDFESHISLEPVNIFQLNRSKLKLVFLGFLGIKLSKFRKHRFPLDFSLKLHHISLRPYQKNAETRDAPLVRCRYQTNFCIYQG